MAFTLDQNVQGAGAFTNPIRPTPNTGLEVAGGLLKGLDTFGRAKIARENAEAAAAKTSLGTQTDRDRQAFSNLLNSARHDLASGKNPDDVSAKYAPQFANLGLDENQEKVLTQLFGDDIFAVSVRPAGVADMGTTLFNNQPESVQLGLIALELQRAEQNEETIDTETATMRAVGSLMTTTAQSQAALQAGNLDYAQGFQGNMQTLDRLTEALSAILSVEARGGDFSLEDLARLRAGYDMLLTQRGFMKPSGTVNQELWEQMNAKLSSVEKIFTALEDYDAKAATAEGKQLMATIVGNLKGEHPLAVLAMKDPSIMTALAAQLSPNIAKELSKKGGVITDVVSYKDLNFDPSIVQLMGFEVKEGGDTASLIPPSDVFPPALVENHSKTLKEPESLTGAITRLGELTEGLVKNPDLILNTPEGVEAWASHVSNMSYLLSEAPSPSSKNLDILFSRNNFKVLSGLEAAGGEFAEQAAILRQQMGHALSTSSNKYALTALGKIQQFSDISIDPETSALQLRNVPELQGINGVVELYYDGDFTKLWKEGPAAFDNLRTRLASSGVISASDQDSPEYKRFLASTAAINVNETDSIFWRGLMNRYSEVAGVTERLQDFKRYEENLRLDVGFQSLIDNASTAIDRAESPEGVQARINAGEIITTPLPAVETPVVVSTLEEVNELPIGTLFINPADGSTIRKTNTGN